MINPFDPSSQSSSANDDQRNSGEPSIRTIKDDLLNLQKGGWVQKKNLPEMPPIQEAPVVNSVPIQTPPEKPPIAPEKKPVIPEMPPLKQELEKPGQQNIKQPALPEEKLNIKTAGQEIANPFFSQSDLPNQKDVVEIPLSEKESSGSGIYLTVVLIFLTVLLIGLGIYYFFITRTPGETPLAESPVAETPVVVAPPTEKYSQDKPSFLVLDLAKITSDEIKTSLIGIATELKNKAPLSPYEFVAVDANNNPIAFPIFATAAKLDLSQTLLENLGENFSIFFYNDEGNIRLSIVAVLKNKDVVFTELLNQEPTFVSDAAFLFLDNIPQIKSGKFNDNVYNGTAIRYLNLDPPQYTLSIDYAVTDSSLIIGTSKNTMRAVIDKLAKKTLLDNAVVPASTPAPSAEENPAIIIETPAATSNESTDSAAIPAENSDSTNPPANESTISEEEPVFPMGQE